MGCNPTGLFHRREQILDCQFGEGGRVVGHRIWEDKPLAVQEAAAGIDHIGHVAFAFVFVRPDERLAQPANDAGGIVPVEQERADAVRSPNLA